MKKPARPKSQEKNHSPLEKVRRQMRKWGIPLSTTVIVIVFILIGLLVRNNDQQIAPAPEDEVPVIVNPDIIPLPSPVYRSQNSVEAVIRINQPRRSFRPDELSQKQLAQMLWAAQGVTTDWGGRTVTSSKSTFPLTVYALVNNVENLEKGVYQYISGERLPAHQLLPLKLGDLGGTLFDLVNQTPLKEPPVVFIITGDLKKMATAYGGVAHDREVYLEAGHATQNMYLQAESLKLGMIALPNFDESQVRLLLSIPTTETIIYLAPVGFIKE
ncbi:MAG: hypothetical protein UW35_C0050G0007 [Candidatus Collierbacteria bacterium GW2011_GWF2_44_15]|uniref:Nitroreductase domain-containing protein n=4 Tax=Candidatus Collieribacteriota TaxID=1752725 RepID=A0A0G1K917_9BACT|nr:MAG: hypothetical protein UW26_C0033G0007 [Candidatus Collierbacteria bacterium GW2011_GWF1_44_12]KKT44319.1 MAG: hypothetical protein UW35_C0050G0007 [Candidatus Collierbacteria bacterium GW2011_GWF2_44_15]